jgi:hypothetical protein
VIICEECRGLDHLSSCLKCVPEGNTIKGNHTGLDKEKTRENRMTLNLKKCIRQQRTNTENSKQIFPEEELRGHSPYFHIHMSVSDFYIPSIVCLFCCRKYVDWSWEYINCTQEYECGNWDWGRAIPRKGIHKWNFVAVHYEQGMLKPWSVFTARKYIPKLWRKKRGKVQRTLSKSRGTVPTNFFLGSYNNICLWTKYLGS